MKKFRVYKYYSGPSYNPYVCTCKSLERAQAAIFKHANSCSPHTVVKQSETKFVAFPPDHPEWKTVFEIEIC